MARRETGTCGQAKRASRPGEGISGEGEAMKRRPKRPALMAAAGAGS